MIGHIETSNNGTDLCVAELVSSEDMSIECDREWVSGKPLWEGTGVGGL